MSFEGMIERTRLQRAEEAGIIECVAVIITGTKRYEQDQMSFHFNIRYQFPDFAANEIDRLEWADRVTETT